jgi:glycosyltransferase involved in cell wall biosynthesis
MTTHRQAKLALYLHDLSGGGIERQALSLAIQCQQQGMHVTLVLHSKTGDLLGHVPRNLPIHVLGSRRTLGDIPRLVRYLRSAQPDILLANGDHNNVAALLAKAFTPQGRTRVIICQHNALSESFSSEVRWTYRLIPMMYRLLAPLVAGAVAVSAGIAGELSRAIPGDKVRIINNAVIGADFEERAAEAVYHPWFNGPGAVLVTAGRLVEAKDQETMLRAFAFHHLHNRDDKLLILGVGPLHARLVELCRKLDIVHAVAFLGFHDNPLPYFREAHCFVLSSKSEGFGNVIVEALGCGTPVISTDCPYGPAEILDNGRYGLLTRAGDIKQLAVAMDKVREMRSAWPSGELQARAAEFSDSACAMKYIALFNTVLSDANPQSVMAAKKRPAGLR